MKKILAILVLVAFSSAHAAYTQKKAEPFSGLFVTTSVLHVGSDSTRIAWEQERDPAIDLHLGSTYGLALGLGWRFASGFDLGVSVLSLRQDVEARWSDAPYGAGPIFGPSDTSRTGFIFTANVPLLRSCR